MVYADEELNLKTDSQTNRQIELVDLAVRTPKDLANLRARWKRMDGIPKLVAVRTDGEDDSFLGFDVRTLLRGEESGGRHTVHSIILSPGAKIPAHGIEAGDAVWFLLHGEIEVTIGAVTRTLKAPAFAYAPEQTTQAIANRSGASAEVYVIHSPAGADRAFSAAHRLWKERPDSAADVFWQIFAEHGFVFNGGKALPNDARTNAQAPRIEADIKRFEDFAALRERWSRLAPTPKIVEFPRQCQNLTPIPGAHTNILLSPEESRAHASAFLDGLDKHNSVAPHHQPSEDEFFILFSGALHLEVGNKAVEAAQYGAFGFAPRYATHAFSCRTDASATFFSMNSPGGHDRGFEYGMTNSAKPGFFEGIEAHGFVFHQPIGLHQT